MKHYGLIGFPLEHSFSKRYYDEKFRVENRHADYQLFPLKDEEALEKFVQENTLDGYNVTLPFKQKIIPLLNELSEEAKETGAVNCVIQSNGRTKGYNTDIFGVEASLHKLVSLQPMPALVFGTGGASRAVQYILKKYHFPFQIVGRKTSDADITYEALSDSLIKKHPLLIQCTSVGMWPNTGECIPIPFHAIGIHHYCFDLIYNPEVTLFLKQAKERGASVMNGMLMLLTQAEKNFEQVI